jgi:acyl carrier protein
MPVLEEIVADVLTIPVHEVTDDTGPAITGSWSSLRHVQIMARVEDQFSIKLGTRQIRSIRTVGDLRAVLRAKGLDA